MKNSLHVLAIVFAAAIPCSIAAGFAGVALPVVLGPGYLVLGFSFVLTLQLLIHDYATVAPALIARVAPITRMTPRSEKFPMRLAA